MDSEAVLPAEAAPPRASVPAGGVDSPDAEVPDTEVPGHGRRQVLAAISAGGMLGALARYGISTTWPHDLAGFPWSTWTINVSGCLLIGVLMVLIGHLGLQHRLVRPFWGIGFLGGYTTFSTATVDVLQTAPGVALVYLAATLTGALVAVWLGTALTEAVVRR